MSRKEEESKSLFEQLGIEYYEVDGYYYPNLKIPEMKPADLFIGKYGNLWCSYLKENHPERYRILMRTGCLWEKMQEINEEACQTLDIITEKYLRKHKPEQPDSTMEMWELREQAKAVAEEFIFKEIVYRFH